MQLKSIAFYNGRCGVEKKTRRAEDKVDCGRSSTLEESGGLGDSGERTLEWAAIRALYRHVEVAEVIVVRRGGDARRGIYD